MKKTIVFGVDLAKNVFQVHGVDHLGNVSVKNTRKFYTQTNC